MQAIPKSLVDQFAAVFAGKGVGFSGKEITDYFGRYSSVVRPYESYDQKPVREDLFTSSLYDLPLKQHYYALNDLTWKVYPAKYGYPNEAVRQELRHRLHNLISTTPIGLVFSELREAAFREDWMDCQIRARTSPAAAITAARTLLEAILKTVVSERGTVPDSSGDLGRLLKQALQVLRFESPQRQGEHMIFSGLASVVNGLAMLSNEAGDRHGLVAGGSIDDPYLAELCINAAGALGLAIIETHLFLPK